MNRASYGLFGSVAYYASLVVTVSLSFILVVFTDYLRPLFMVTLLVSVALLTVSLVFLQPLSGSRRIKSVPEIVTAGRIGAGDRVLDVGTGRGFPAVEIAKAVAGCYVVGIDVWDEPAEGQMHKGFVVGNSRESAERNALLEGVSDRVEFRQCDAREMPFESESFNVVVSSLALHQMVYFDRLGHRVLEEIYRVLKPGGRLAVVDVMIGSQMIEKLRGLGFKEIQMREVRGQGLLSPFLKILSALKVDKAW